MARRKYGERCTVETPQSAQQKFHNDLGNTVSYILEMGYTLQDMVDLFEGAIKEVFDLNWPEVLAHAYEARRKYGYLDNVAYVYVWRGEHGEPLYVGQTLDIVDRTEKHLRSSPWAFEAWSLEVRRSTKGLRLAQEKALIKELSPKYNVMHNESAMGDNDE